jgi:hypothetical protein
MNADPTEDYGAEEDEAPNGGDGGGGG